MKHKNNSPTGFLKTVLFTVLELVLNFYKFIFLFPFGFLLVSFILSWLEVSKPF